MKIAIIGEFNPFHKGHESFIKEIKNKYPESTVAVIMSGDFNQRGIPAVIDKWKRAEIALNSGCDLIVEMPIFYTLSPAKEFARGGVEAAISLGAEFLAFGSESGDIETLKKAAKKSLNFDENNKIFLKGKRAGKSYSETLIKILSEEFPEKIGSNDILGIEYIKSIEILSSSIKPLTIKRNEDFMSADEIRKNLKKDKLKEIEKFLPEYSLRILKSTEKYVFFEDFSPLILYLLTISSKPRLMEIHGANEEMINRLLKFRKKTGNLKEIIELTASKNFSQSKIRRFLISLMIGIKTSAIKKESPLRILAANSQGLSMIKDKNILKNLKTQKDFELNFKASNIYNLALKGEINKDFKTPPVIK